MEDDLQLALDDLAEAYFHRGGIRYIRGDVAEVIEDLRRYLELRLEADVRESIEQRIAELEAELSIPTSP